MLERKDNKNPHVGLAAFNFRRVERVPAPSQKLFRRDGFGVKTSREFDLKCNGFTWAGSGSNQKIDAVILGRYPNLVFIPKLTDNMVSDKEFAFMDSE